MNPPHNPAATVLRELVLLRDHEEQASGGTGEEAELWRILSAIVLGTATSVGDEFFATIVRELTEASGYSTGLVGELVGRDKIRTLAVWSHGTLIDNFEYDVAGTPCANVVTQGTCFYPSSVCDRFPEDYDLRDMGAESYLGTPIKDTGGTTHGLLALIGDAPHTQSVVAESMLAIVAVRAGAELGRLRAERKSETAATQLRQAQKLESLGLLAGGIAHDFNNLLTVIIANAEVVSESAAMIPTNPAVDAVRHGIEEIMSAGVRGATMTKQLLAFSRTGGGGPTIINLGELIQSSQQLLVGFLPETIELKVAVDPETLNIVAERGQIDQVLMNLVLNARDAMPDGGTLFIECRNVHLDGRHAETHVGAQAGMHVQLRVTDTGTGIDPEIVDMIFDPLFTSKPEGTGLGLATVSAVVSRAGGHIILETSPQQGAVFTINLPATGQRCAADTDSPVNESHESGRGTILFCDDEPQIRHTMCQYLRQAGYFVIDAGDGQAGLEQAETFDQPIDLLISDVVMPNMGGPELAAKLRTRQPGIAVLLVSGHTGDQLDRSGLDLSTTSFLQKPFRPSELLRRAREVMNQRAANPP